MHLEQTLILKLTAMVKMSILTAAQGFMPMLLDPVFLALLLATRYPMVVSHLNLRMLLLKRTYQELCSPPSSSLYS